MRKSLPLKANGVLGMDSQPLGGGGACKIEVGF